VRAKNTFPLYWGEKKKEKEEGKADLQLKRQEWTGKKGGGGERNLKKQILYIDSRPMEKGKRRGRGGVSPVVQWGAKRVSNPRTKM